ncbi:histone H4 [Dissoconium aciculare CBS 342.82]|uniref:Histone H4 n=1 Tax=Dissoconium aciculare CBS 342.82 TaxID=1314786 RepID=A0A6J3M264_9PEZI|nr:histone H4 [Dissoconium aciculare CBS 342.82]KAF1821584.1 histone H4 [Dissoconium aciculare CBS 342.82]
MPSLFNFGLLRSDVPHKNHTGGKSIPPSGFTSINAPPKTSHGIGGIGLGHGKSATKRHRKILKDTIQGITRGDIRRLARRGGVKRISAAIYPSVRMAVKQRLEDILNKVIPIVENTGRKTVQTMDVVYALNMLGNPIYGFGEANKLSQLK